MTMRPTQPAAVQMAPVFDNQLAVLDRLCQGGDL